MKFKIESLIESSLPSYIKRLGHFAAICMLFCVQTSSWSQTSQINFQIATQKNVSDESAVNAEMQSQIDAINNIVEVSVIIQGLRRAYASKLVVIQ